MEQGESSCWGNRCLFYHVKVLGNTFIQTVSPFEGTLTGSFMCGTHESKKRRNWTGTR